MEDKNFAERLNILRAGVLGANDGIISIAGVVIGVASATSNIWFILISALSAIFAGAFSVGSLPPTLAILLFPETYRIPVTVVVVALTLLLTGYVSAKLGKAPVKQAMLRNLTVGLLTMLVTFAVGHIFPVNV